MTIIIVNNESSGMIADHERTVFGEDMYHVSRDNGYILPDFKALAFGYGISYTCDESAAPEGTGEPLIYEIKVTDDIPLEPNLPRGNRCQDMYPPLPQELAQKLDML